MSLTRRLLLGRGAIGALLSPVLGPTAGRSVAGRLAASAALGVDAFPPPTGDAQAGGRLGPAARAFSPAWWSRNRWEAEDQVLQAGYTLPVDADVAGMRSLSPMAQQRIMRRRWIDRRVAERTVWDRAARLFDQET